MDNDRIVMVDDLHRCINCEKLVFLHTYRSGKTSRFGCVCNTEQADPAESEDSYEG